MTRKEVEKLAIRLYADIVIGEREGLQAFEEIAYSIGKYGINSYLFKGNDGKFYYIPSRCTALYKYMIWKD